MPTFSYNIIVRILIYIAETYRRYIDRNGLDEYSTTTMELPRPEFYMVFTGERKEHPETISFRKDIPGMEGCPVDVEVKVIYESAKGDILSQYIEFSKIFTEQYKLYGKTQKTIDETLRICRERNILNDYLKKEGVSTIMYRSRMFHQEHSTPYLANPVRDFSAAFLVLRKTYFYGAGFDGFRACSVCFWRTMYVSFRCE